jgi:hypothetical protein
LLVKAGIDSRIGILVRTQSWQSADLGLCMYSLSIQTRRNGRRFLEFLQSGFFCCKRWYRVVLGDGVNGWRLLIFPRISLVRSVEEYN